MFQTTILGRMMSEKYRELCGPLQAPDVLPGQEGHSKTRYPLLLLETRWYWYLRGAGSLHLVHYMHDGGARTGTRYPKYLQGAVTGNTKEASGQRTTAFVQGRLAISATGGQVPP